MKKSKMLMGMPITVDVVDASVTEEIIEKVFAYFTYVDEKFSTYKDTSEISRINRGELAEQAQSEDMRTVLALCEETKKLTNGYFEIKTPGGTLDPSGLVKGWAIWNAAQLLDACGCRNFYVDAGGDIQVRGKNGEGKTWSVGIRNPFNDREIVKTVYAKGEGVATSGTYIRGQHIYDPKTGKPVSDIVSLTVIGPNIYEADRFATAAFAMGRQGIEFLERLKGFEGYLIDTSNMATMTSGFTRYAEYRE